jgi:hypothetical protein
MRHLLAMVILTCAVPVAADPTPPTDVTKMAADDCARARKMNKTCVLSIEGEDLTGTAPTAGQSPISVHGFTDHASLIRIRHDFIPEILRTAEDL